MRFKSFLLFFSFTIFITKQYIHPEWLETQLEPVVGLIYTKIGLGTILFLTPSRPILVHKLKLTISLDFPLSCQNIF